MDIVRFTLNNPVKIAVGVILLLLFGALAVTSIPIQLTPNVDPTIITVTTEWTGTSPEEIEREIIEEQEDALKNLSDLEKMTAIATQGQSEIELEFGVGVDLQAARVAVSDALREVPDYPADVEEPVITTGEAGPGSPIAWLLLTSDDPGFDVQKLGDLAQDRIKPALERAPGVSEVRVYGGREREVHINFDPKAIAQRRVTVPQLGEALRARNVNVSAGDLAEGKYNVRVRTIGQYETLDAIRNTIVTYDEDGGPIYISDLGEVTLDYQKRRSFVRARGELAIAMPVYRESGSNVIQVMQEVRQRIDQINDPTKGLLQSVSVQIAREQGLANPPKLQLEQVYDETGYIYDALALVRSNLIIGGVLAVIALLLFLELGRRPMLVLIGAPLLVGLMLLVLWLPAGVPFYYGSIGGLLMVGAVVLYIARPTLVIALAIPISIIGTFVVMFGAGRNINVISLAGLAFAVGMVVDNAIVVLENIDRHLNMGKKRFQAAYDATREVWGAILASTLTTLAVFIPVIFIQEEAGQLFRDIALAICGAVTLSLIVSVTVIPTSSARLLHERKKRGQANATALSPAVIFGRLASGYSRLIHLTTHRGVFGVGVRMGIVTLFTLASLVGAMVLMPPTDYLPRGNQNLVFGIMINPPGYNIERDEAMANVVEAQIRPYWEAESQDELAELQPPLNPFTQQPIENIPALDNYFFVSFNGSVFNGATSMDKQNIKPIEGLLSSATSSIPGSIGFAQQSSIFGRGASGSRAIDVEVSGQELAEVRRAASAMQDRLRAMYGPMNLQPSPTNFDKSARELRLEIDEVKARNLGIEVDALGRAVSAMVDGLIVGDYRMGGESIDIVAKSQTGFAYSPEQLAALPLVYLTPTGETGTIPLSEVSVIRRADAPQEIQRIEELRSVKLSVTPPDTVPLEEATRQIRALETELRDSGAIDPTIQVNYAGSASKLDDVRTAMLGNWTGFDRESFNSLARSRLLIALLVTFLLMAALFESFLYPLVIMFSVPLATIGGFIGLAIVHHYVPSQQLDTLTMLGFVILIGVVVNNAILIVHQALNFMRGVGEGEGDDTGRLEPREAIRASVRSRIRPIFMTTTTSVAGMLPLVLMPGSGSELYRGLGSVVVGGLVVSTLFTLIVVPLLFSLVIDVRLAYYRLLGREGQAAELVS
ncbi:MAG: efflux RND transporter permease subunit [Planctomycetota bacterium]